MCVIDTRIAPSLQDRQRKLKRARLQDYLNDKLQHRPGPLELVQGNILKLSSYDGNDSVVNPVISTFGLLCQKQFSSGFLEKYTYTHGTRGALTMLVVRRGVF